MKIALGKFTRDGIELELGPDLGGAVQAALSHYRVKLESGRPPLRAPRFLVPREPRGAEPVLDLGVDVRTEAILVREAREQELEIEQLVEHMVLVYLAELDFLATAESTV